MGVLACDVNGCTNIMCDRISYQLNKYICDDCFERLTEKGILDRAGIERFFETSKQEELLSKATEPRQYYSEVFRPNWDREDE